MANFFKNLRAPFTNLRHFIFYALITQRNRETVTLGDRCQWTVQSGSIDQNSVVYSAGIGRDISFEKELVREFGCRIILLDPSPTGAATMDQTENQTSRLQFEPIGLADSDGTFCFDAPNLDQEGSYRIEGSPGSGGHSFRCSSLPTLMQKHGHNHIDLLKMDIEGFEYGVLKQICSQNLAVRQICVEFHHSLLPGIRREQTVGIIIKLLRSGYKLIHRTDWDHTFILS